MTDTTQSTPRLRDGPRSFGLISRLNHWIVATAFLCALGLGLFMEYGGLPREAIGGYMNWHKLFGLTVFLWGAWRLVWRLVQGFPQPASAGPRWQEVSAKVVHWALLAATIAIPLSGILMSLANGRALSVFGTELLPAMDKLPWLADLAHETHEAAPWVLVALLFLHIGGALKHQIFDRDGTLARMTTGSRALDSTT